MRGIRDLIFGIKYRVPFCCIVAYLRGANALKNGVIVRSLTDLNNVYVPCFFHKKQAITHAEYEKKLNDEAFINKLCS